jgi:phosphopantetheinyl transferase
MVYFPSGPPIWTRKEAYAKALGLGFSRAFASFSVLSEPDPYRLLNLQVVPQHVARVAAEGSDWHAVFRGWSRSDELRV